MSFNIINYHPLPFWKSPPMNPVPFFSCLTMKVLSASIRSPISWLAMPNSLSIILQEFSTSFQFSLHRSVMNLMNNFYFISFEASFSSSVFCLSSSEMRILYSSSRAQHRLSSQPKCSTRFNSSSFSLTSRVGSFASNLYSDRLVSLAARGSYSLGSVLTRFSNRKSLEKLTEEGLESVLCRKETAEMSRARLRASRRFFRMRYSVLISQKQGTLGYSLSLSLRLIRIFLTLWASSFSMDSPDHLSFCSSSSSFSLLSCSCSSELLILKLQFLTFPVLSELTLISLSLFSLFSLFLSSMLAISMFSSSLSTYSQIGFYLTLGNWGDDRYSSSEAQGYYWAGLDGYRYLFNWHVYKGTSKGSYCYQGFWLSLAQSQEIIRPNSFLSTCSVSLISSLQLRRELSIKLTFIKVSQLLEMLADCLAKTCSGFPIILLTYFNCPSNYLWMYLQQSRRLLSCYLVQASFWFAILIVFLFWHSSILASSAFSYFSFTLRKSF